MAIGDPVARLDTLVEQPGCYGIRLLVCFSISEALTFIDNIGPVSEIPGGEPDFANARRGILVNTERVAKNLSLGDFEITARTGQFLARLQKFCVVHVSPQWYFWGSYMPYR
jgi:hypothetical protein